MPKENESSPEHLDLQVRESKALSKLVKETLSTTKPLLSSLRPLTKTLGKLSGKNYFTLEEDFKV